MNGPNDTGKKPKAPSARGWESPGHKGVNPKVWPGWYGLRCDGLIVIDCDSAESMATWLDLVGAPLVNGQYTVATSNTWVRKTPRGYHFIYRWHDPLGELDHLRGPHAGVLPGIDVRQGASSQIVYSAPGYETLRGSPVTLEDFHPPWAATFVLRSGSDSIRNADTWDEMPEGVGNNTMAALAGTMRKQGMSVVTMVRCLAAINKITMTRDPMPKDMLIDIARSVSRYAVDPVITEIPYDDNA